MRNWQIMGILIFLIIGTVLISGCTSTESTSKVVSTPTPQIEHTNVPITPTQTPTVVNCEIGPQSVTNKVSNVKIITAYGQGSYIYGEIENKAKKEVILTVAGTSCDVRGECAAGETAITLDPYEKSDYNVFVYGGRGIYIDARECLVWVDKILR